MSVRLIIAGPRYIGDPVIVNVAVRKMLAADQGLNLDDAEVVSGCAHGVDRLGEKWAERCDMPVKRFPANWDKYGPSAGPIRNREMAAYATHLLAIWDGKSRGTANMIAEARRAGLVVYVHLVQP